ncbi:acylphosphatase [bacterium]|nr:acylphosphatase [bacterium]
MSKTRVHIFVSGLVQGVFFRYFTKKTADKLNLKGWVKNLDDGRVEILAEGDEERIEELIRWTQKGSPASKVENVEIKYEDYKGEFGSFEIRY